MLYVVRDPDSNADGDKLPCAVTRKANVDNHSRICYNDIENIMNNNRITNIGNPTNDLDAVNKLYVDSRKRIIAIWAEENGNLNQYHYDRSWGSGASGSQYGYLMLSSERIIRAGASINPHYFSANIEIRVSGLYKSSFSKISNKSTTITVFNTPIE